MINLQNLKIAKYYNNRSKKRSLKNIIMSNLQIKKTKYHNNTMTKYHHNQISQTQNDKIA